MDVLKKQLVNLTVELDDQTKTCSALKKKIEVEESNVDQLDVKIPIQYEHQLRQEAAEHQKEMSSIITDIKKLNVERDSLRDGCKETKNAIVGLDDQIRKLKVTASEHVTQSVEQQSKQFRASSDVRWQKMLSKRSAEVKESTLKELQPIFQKLQLDHEKEISEIELNAQTQESVLRASFQNNLQEIIELDEKHAKEESKAQSTHKDAAASTQLEEMGYEHKQRKQQLVEDLDDNLARETRQVQARMERERAAQTAELRDTQENVKRRLKGVYSAHEAALAQMKDESRAELRRLEQGFEELKRQLEARLRAEAEEAGTKASGSPKRSPGRRSRDGAGSCSASTADALASHRTLLVQERDRKVQQEIRQLHTDTVRLEREWREQHDAGRKQLVQHKEVEEQNCGSAIKHLNARITEMVVEKEDLLRDVTALKRETQQNERELQELQKEISTFENGISIQTVRIREKRSISSYKLREEDGATERLVKDLRRQVEALEHKRALRLKEVEAEMSEIQYVHNIELESLEKGVKSTVAVKDKEVQTLQDDIEMEESRMESLQEVLRRYSVRAPSLGAGVDQSQSRLGTAADREDRDRDRDGGRGGSTAAWNSDTSTRRPKSVASGGGSSSSAGASSCAGSRKEPLRRQGGVDAGSRSSQNPKPKSKPVPVSRFVRAGDGMGSDAGLESAIDAADPMDASDVSSLGSRTFATTVSGSGGDSRHRGGGGGRAANRYTGGGGPDLNYEDTADDNNSEFVAEINDLYG